MTERSHLVRNLVVSVAAIVVLVVAAVLTAPLWLPTSIVSEQIAALVRQKTNRDLRIAGPISFSLLPQVALVAHDVTLSSPAGFSANLLEAKTVDVALAPLPLLHGAVDIDRLILSQPTVNLEINQAGERNWVFRKPPTTSTAATNSVRSPALASFVAGEVKLDDGTTTYLDQRNGRKETVGSVNLTLSLPNAAGPLNAAGTIVANGETVRLAATVAAPENLGEGASSAATIDVASARASLGFRGEVAAGGKAAGALSLKTPSLHAFLDWLHTGLAPNDSGDAPLALDGKIDLGDATATLSDATMTLGGITAHGTLALHRADHRVELDLDDLVLYGGKGAGKIVADDSAAPTSFAANLALKGIGVQQLPIGIAGFDTLSGTGGVTVDLTASGRTMHDIVRSLGGTGSIAFADGSVGSGGLAPALKRAAGPLVSDKAVPREFAYHALSATATIDHGILHNTDLKLSGAQASATGSGTLDLAQHSIDYLWQPDIAGFGNARVDITGAWDAPDYKIESLNITGGKGLNIPGLKLR